MAATMRIEDSIEALHLQRRCAISTALPRTTARLLASAPFRTWHVEVTAPVRYETSAHEEWFDQLVAALADAGFVQDPAVVPPPPVGGRRELHFARPGGDVFGSWTTAERRPFLRAAKGALKRFGFSAVPQVRLRLTDLL